MFVRGLIVLVSLSTATAFAAPVPKSLRALPSKMDTARFKLNYSKAPFDRVLEDFAEGTGLEWVGDRPYLGTLTLKPNKEYSGVEFLDLINELLEKDNFIVIRHGKTFYLHAADRPVDMEKVDTVSIEDVVLPRKAAVPPADPAPPDWAGGGGWNGNPWGGPRPVEDEKKVPPKRGKTELATAVIPLTTVAYDDIRPQVVKSLSMFGQGVEACEGGRAMRVTDRVDNLRFIYVVVTDPRKSNCVVK